MSLITTPNITDRDGVYAQLIAAHRGLDDQASAALNARLILILMNHIGDEDVIDAALKLATDVGA